MLRVLRSGLINKPKVVIVDYGVGNLLSVQRAVEHCGGMAVTSSEPDVISNAPRIILPGVGAYANGIRALEVLGIAQALKEVAARGAPLLGICLGMQLLFDESEEHGSNKGLGIVPGRVVPIPDRGPSGTKVKIPHIGWNALINTKNEAWDKTILRSLMPGEFTYFVHSFMAEPVNPEMRVADFVYGGLRIPAVITHENVTGCQFHPEKSGETGLTIITNFVHFKN